MANGRRSRISLCGVLTLLLSGIACAQQSSPAVKLSVDLSDAARRIYHAKMEFPVKAGPLTLVYPEWIPGEHGPTGPIVDLTGLHFRVGEKDILWKRDDVDMYAFHCDIPDGAEKLAVTLDYLLPTKDESGGAPSASAEVAVLPWNLVVLYPQGAKSDDVMFSPSLRVPQGWKFATALPIQGKSGEETNFKTVSLTTLVDSPVLAGQYLKTYDLSPGETPDHRLNVAADSEAASVATPEQLRDYRQLVAETGALFGARHYRHYDFLLALSDYLDVNGLEHHESSDNRAPERTLLDPSIFEWLGDLLPHEFFHSWNGKYRRPAGLATPNYQEPMKGDLLWVYEGLTQYYGTMLAARSGIWTQEELREDLATVAAYLNDRPGRTWRNLEDTAIAAQLLYGSRKAGSAWRRGVDYYDESTLIWLEADTIIRRETHGKKSLDDFCRAFHGGESTGPKLIPYTFEDVVSGLNAVAPYDWKKFFDERLYSHGPAAPLAGLETSGWKLIFTDKMNDMQRATESVEHTVDLRYSLGFTVKEPGGDDGGSIVDVIPGSPAAKAGIAPDMILTAVNGRDWTPDSLREAVRAAKNSNEPIALRLRNDSYAIDARIDYHQGERYPHLQRASGADVLAEIAKARAPEVK